MRRREGGGEREREKREERREERVERRGERGEGEREERRGERGEGRGRYTLHGSLKTSQWCVHPNDVHTGTRL